MFTCTHMVILRRLQHAELNLLSWLTLTKIHQKQEVMKEDGLEDVDKLVDPEKEKQREAMKFADVTSDSIGTNYLKVINSVSFSDLATYTVELPV